MHVYEPPTLKTGLLGGVYPSDAEIAAMQDGDYVLRARDGRLTEVPAEKSMLQPDPESHPQGVSIALAEDGTVYVVQDNTVSVSADGGRTWRAHGLGAGPSGEKVGRKFQVLSDGSVVTAASHDDEPNVAKIYTSADEGRTWRHLSRIEVPADLHTAGGRWYPNVGVLGLVHRGAGDTLVCMINAHTNDHTEDWGLISGEATLLSYRSADGGKTWEGPSHVMTWATGEGGVARAPSGKLLLAVRYQRPALPTDPPDLLEWTGAARINAAYPYKHVFLVDSQDEGRTWGNPRQLTTVFGQCYCYPAALSDGTAAVVHDTRYGPGPSVARAMISRDEGDAWEDEVYYVFAGKAATGYSQSVVFDDDTLLTVGGFSDYTEGNPRSWNNWTGRSQLVAIRWKPVSA